MKTNKLEQAFAYLCSPRTLHAIVASTDYTLPAGHESDTILIGINENKELITAHSLFLTDVRTEPIDRAVLLLAMETTLKPWQDKFDKVSRTALINAQRDRTPIYRFKNGIVLADELGIKPWHHMLFIDDYVFVYVWDTRIVEKVLPVKDFAGVMSRMLIDANDNNKPLVFTSETEQYKSVLKGLRPSKRI